MKVLDHGDVLGKSSWTQHRGLLKEGSKFLPRTCPSTSHSGHPCPRNTHLLCHYSHSSPCQDPSPPPPSLFSSQLSTLGFIPPPGSLPRSLLPPTASPSSGALQRLLSTALSGAQGMIRDSMKLSMCTQLTSTHILQAPSEQRQCSAHLHGVDAPSAELHGLGQAPPSLPRHPTAHQLRMHLPGVCCAHS